MSAGRRNLYTTDVEEQNRKKAVTFMFAPGHSQVGFLQQSQEKTICSYPTALLFYGCEHKPARIVFIFCTGFYSAAAHTERISELTLMVQ